MDVSDGSYYINILENNGSQIRHTTKKNILKNKNIFKSFSFRAIAS
jgi:hypothetical protein